MFILYCLQALQFTDKAAFVDFLTEGLAPPPQYFVNAVQMNLAGLSYCFLRAFVAAHAFLVLILVGADSMADVVGRVSMLAPIAFKAAMGGSVEAKSVAMSDKVATTECKDEGEAEVIVLDTRNANDFASQFIPGSLNFPVGIHGGETLAPEEGNFGIWVCLFPSSSWYLIGVPPSPPPPLPSSLIHSSCMSVLPVF